MLAQGDAGTAQGKKESHLEDVCLDCLANVGWTVAEGEMVALGGELTARGRWSE